MIYVDELRPVLRGPMKRYGQTCHLMADTDQELEAFATRLGLCRRWKHNDHFDLTPARRAKAVRLGAVEITSRALAQRRSER